MKGVLQPDHIPVNNYELQVLGLPAMTFTAISGLEEELDVVDLPDRTRASGGDTRPVEFTVTQPAHHTAEVMAMEIWFREGQDPVLPTYKKPATLIKRSLSGQTLRAYSLTGVFVSRRATADLEMDNEGEMDTIEWTLNADKVLPI